MASTSSSHQQNAFSEIEPLNKRIKTEESYRVYDVFINHRGPDVKLTLAAQLYKSLGDLDIKAFLDSEEEERGVSFISTIEPAIRSASVHIAIFSRKYAESDWCLRELVLMLQTNAKIIPVFYQVEPWELRHIEKGVFADSFLEYEKKGRHLDKLREWKEALKKISYVAGHEFKNSYSNDCKDIVSSVEKEVQWAKRLHGAQYPVGLSKLVKDFEKRGLDELVQDFESQFGMKKSDVVGIVGVGGVGKTTLSVELFNQKRLNYSRASFLFDVREACVSGKLPSLQSKLLKDIFGEDQIFDSIEEGKSYLRNFMIRSSSLSFLIVLDDIDHVYQLDALLVMEILNKSDNNLVIITTRDVGVLVRSGIDFAYHLKGLDRQDGRELFCWHAFHQNSPIGGYEDLVEAFVNVCGGLPLSLIVLGRHVFGRDQWYWQNELEKVKETLPGDINQRLRKSIDALDNLEKQIFMDIACFFIGASITTGMTIWESSGWGSRHALERLKEKCLVEEVKVSYLNLVVDKWESSDNRSLFRMHDRLRDLEREMADELSYPRRLWRPRDLRSMRLRGFQDILAIGNVRFFHSFLDMSMLCQITLFIDRPKDSSNSNLLWLQLDFLNSDMKPALPSWIPLQNLQCLRIRNGRLQRLWESHHRAPCIQLKELQISETFLEEVPDLGLFNSLKNVALDAEYLAMKGWSLLESLRLNIRTLHWNSFTLEGNFSTTDAEGYPASSYLIIQNFQQRIEEASNKYPMSVIENLEISNQNLVTEISISGNQFTRLKTLKVNRMENLIEMQLFRITTLNSLHLNHCENLKVVLGISDLTKLVELNISQCSKLEIKSFLSSLSYLKTLELHRMENLVEINLFRIKTLNSLHINCCGNLKRVSGISSLTKLVELNIYQCPGLESELFLSSLCDLKRIRIENCKNLKIVSGISNLEKLVELNISQCPELESSLPLPRLHSLKNIRVRWRQNAEIP